MVSSGPKKGAEDSTGFLCGQNPHKELSWMGRGTEEGTYTPRQGLRAHWHPLAASVSLNLDSVGGQRRAALGTAVSNCLPHIKIPASSPVFIAEFLEFLKPRG